jgi:DNA processing protein
MTLDEAVALSLLTALPRVGLTDRLRAGDPGLRALAADGVERARRVQARAERDGLGVLAWNDPRFPLLLRAIPDTPPALWYRGRLASLDAPAVAIVGSRAASAAGLETAARLGADLAARGLVVVSGLARGIDAAAHRGALSAGATIAVLGSGLDRVYPAEHAELAREVAGSGLLLSEFPPGAPPLAFHFPLRNRLISGLSLAVVVIEAAEKSGSLITAACALEQGRDVMAVPGTVLGGRNTGGHGLIRDGAKIVERADDIVSELRFGGLSSCGVDADARSARSTSCRDPVLAVMVPGETHDLDELSAGSGLAPARLLPRLLDLELRGLVRRAGGGRFLRLS